MSGNIFSYLSYKKFLRESDFNISKLERSIGYKSNSLSKIIYSENALPLDKGLLMANVLGFSHCEEEYFLLLIEFESAGTDSLRRLFLRSIHKCIQKKFILNSTNGKDFIDLKLPLSWYTTTLLLKNSKLNVMTEELLCDLSPRDIEKLRDEVTLPCNPYLSIDNHLSIEYKRSWRRKGLSHLEVDDENGHRSIYTLYSLLTDLEVQQIKSTYIELLQKILYLISSDDTNDTKNPYNLNLDFFKVLSVYR